jgi:hypothetical protein
VDEFSITYKKKETDSKLHTYAAMLFGYWKYLINYKSFNDLNTQALRKSAAGIVFSNYLSKLISGDGSDGSCNVIYHGSFSALPIPITQKEARERLLLPRISRVNHDNNKDNNKNMNKKIAITICHS